MNEEIKTYYSNKSRVTPNNSRQVPTNTSVTREKNYCDLLYSWLQCHSELCNFDTYQRRILKTDVKFTKIERDFTRQRENKKTKQLEEYKEMTRKTISKYFDYLLDKGLVMEADIEKGEDDSYYYLKVLSKTEAGMIEYNTLSKMVNVFQRHSISIYAYLFNRFYANHFEPYIVTTKQVKEYIGIATSTTSNNGIVSDTLEILERLGLIKYSANFVDGKTLVTIEWVKNQLPDINKLK